MKPINFTCAMVSLSLLCSGCVSGKEITTDYTNTISQMRSFFGERMAADQVTGAAVALVDGDRVVWVEGFGYADAAKNVAAKSDTIFEIGSNSKQLATLALMRLSDAGKLDIDKPIESYLPEFRINQRFPLSSPVTIRSILTHHSGLPTDIFIGSFTANRADPLWLDWLLGYLKDEYTANPVGYASAYSNTAFALLHKVIENA